MDTETLHTGADLLRLSRPGYELVRGRLVEVTPPGGEHGEIASNVVLVLKSYVRGRDIGKVVVESGFYLERDPDTVRAPDISFYSRGRIARDGLSRGYLEVPPDLAVEIVSPHDRSEDVEQRVHEFFSAGVRRVWVLYPRTRTLHVFQSEARVEVLDQESLLADPELLPGLEVRVADFFVQD
ncbi:MAG: Uma2 family endonuclease [Armatimonadetes bacterium]|nr:Uma2 family endonuclease [Armatimonadota bacterium]